MPAGVAVWIRRMRPGAGARKLPTVICTAGRKIVKDQRRPHAPADRPRQTGRTSRGNHDERMIELTKREFVSLMLGLPATTFLSHIAGAQSADALNIAFMADVQSWDPTSVTFPVGQSIFKCVYDSPLHLFVRPEAAAAPDRLAQMAGRQSTRLEITLRDDIFFHDGSKLTTEDVKYSWLTRRRRTSGWRSPACCRT